jgi:large subunit ribosomal protein L17
MLTSLLTTGSMKTTTTKAKVIASEFDALVSLVARQADQREQIRSAKRVLYTEEAQKNLIENVIPNAKAKSGYTRQTKLGPRKGDAAEMVSIEILSFTA